MINIYGKGGHAKVVASALISTIDYGIKFFNDDDYDPNRLGTWLIAIGNNYDRKRIANKLAGHEFGIIIADNANCDLNINPGEGTQILQSATVQVGTKIGKHCIINTAASIDHDCILSDFSFIGPNVTLCGGVEIGECSFIGAGSVILPYIKIGKNCMIGAGSVVTKDIPNNTTAYGNPAKIK